MKRWKCPDCGASMGACWQTRHKCGQMLRSKLEPSKEVKELEVYRQALDKVQEALEQIHNDVSDIESRRDIELIKQCASEALKQIERVMGK